MRHLPPRTRLPASLIERRHAPRPGAYPLYRSCLRWEFAFSCAFCWVHESDLIEHGVEGLGLTAIEHHRTRSAYPELTNDYHNCFYACRLCNTARGDSPDVSAVGGHRLLDPCTVAWVPLDRTGRVKTQ